MPDKNWQFELEEYIKQGEPDRAEKSEAWQTAIGLQAVDGLNTSEYLLDTAKDHGEVAGGKGTGGGEGSTTEGCADRVVRLGAK